MKWDLGAPGLDSETWESTTFDHAGCPIHAALLPHEWETNQADASSK